MRPTGTPTLTGRPRPTPFPRELAALLFPSAPRILLLEFAGDGPQDLGDLASFLTVGTAS